MAWTPKSFVPDSAGAWRPSSFVADSAAQAPKPRGAVRQPLNVAAHPLAGILSQIRPEHGLAMLPAAGATLGGVLGIPGGPLGVGGFGALGAAGGRTLENMGRQAMGMPQNQSVTEMLGFGRNLPPFARGTIDVGEQALFGGLLEGVPAKLFGVPGRIAGSLQQSAAGIAKKAETKTVERAVEKSQAVGRARTPTVGEQASLADEAARMGVERAKALDTSSQLTAAERSAVEAERVQRTIAGVRSQVAAEQMTAAERSAVEAERVQRGIDRARSRLSARDIGPDIEAASGTTTAARQQAGAAKKIAVRGAAESGVEVSLDDLAKEVMDRQRELFGRVANPVRLLKQIRREIASVIDEYTAGAIRMPRGSSRIVDASGKPIQAAPIRFSAEVADNMKKALAEKLTAQFAGIERGATPKGGLRNMVQRALRDVLEEKIPDLGDLNRQAGAAIRESRQVESLAARQSGPTVSRLREIQATRAAEASARQGARPSPVMDAARQASRERVVEARARQSVIQRRVEEAANQARRERAAEASARQGVARRPVREAVRQAQRDRIATALARDDFNRPFFTPHITAHGFSFPAATPGRLALGASRLLDRPGVMATGRYGGDAINLLFRALTAQGIPPTPELETLFNAGQMPPDTLSNY